MKSLSGVLAPVVTTFDPQGELIRSPFSANVRAHLAAGLAGVVVAGSTGEAALLDDDERNALVEWARADVPGDRWLIAGVGSESTRQCVRRARDAADRGADAVLVVAPHYYGSAMTVAALRAHYGCVADESPVPVLLYNIPKYMHFALDPALVAELAAHGNIVGIKDSSGDPALLGGYLAAQSAEFTVLTGSGGGLAAALAAGARGGILAVSLFAPELTLEVLREHAGDAAEESEGAAQRALVPLAREIVAGLGVAGVKAALDLSGLHGGPTRAPLLPLPPPERERVAALLRAARTPAAV